jgi:hypothetical protein
MESSSKITTLLGILVALSLVATACSVSRPSPAPSAIAIVQATSTPSQTPTPTKNRTPTATPVLPISKSCLPNAKFVQDLTVPDGTQFAAGQSFTKQWRLLSKGCLLWPAGTSLAFVSGDRLSDLEEVTVPDTPLGNTVDIAVDMVAPKNPGRYRSYWQLKDPSGDLFGERIYVDIVVVAPTPAFVADTPTPATRVTDTPTPATRVTDTPIPIVEESTYILYFYFGAEGCPRSRQMAPKIERFSQEYGIVAARPDEPMLIKRVLAAPPLQEPERRKYKVRGVAVDWWGGDPNAFVSATGVTFPIVGDPGLNVDTSHIPVTVVLNEQTGVYRVATIGDVSYETLVSQVDSGGVTARGSY